VPLLPFGHDARLAIFRFLVKAGEGGLNVGQIGAHLGIAPFPLAHHPGALVETGLIRLGREVASHAAFAAIQRLADFLVAECCAGLPALQTEEATGRLVTSS
jgi:ArsR family transcriptional regulator, arsenate/arsenite/antimonite-responsive transcriptional repressor